ncbi:MAG: hypothetical protein KGP35_03790 [Bacteroidetes bacterium]|nr:hypothetical protein [Bacteroidota bacterium]
MGTAIICLIITLINYFKLLKLQLLLYVIFYSFSILSSTQSIFIKNENISNVILGLFFSFDIFFFSYFLKNVLTKELINVRFIYDKIGLISFLLFMFINIFTHSSTKIISIINSGIILIASLPVFLKFYSDDNDKVLIKDYEFWILSGYIINSITTLIGSTIIVIFDTSYKNIIYQLLFITMYVSWALKYLMILKSNSCKMKHIKYGD